MIVENALRCRVKDLGFISYKEAFEQQKLYVEQVLQGGEQTLLLCEHPAVLTLGRLAEGKNILASIEQLKESNVEIININRGGDVTLHAPGQLVVYPIFNLIYYGKDLRLYLERLEQVAIDLLSEFDILANRNLGKTGVWVGNHKIASLGIGVRKWISFHGIAINVNTDLKLFSLIRPCGMDVQMTSMAKLKKKPIDMNLVKELTVKHFKKNFCLT